MCTGTQDYKIRYVPKHFQFSGPATDCSARLHEIETSRKKGIGWCREKNRSGVPMRFTNYPWKFIQFLPRTPINDSFYSHRVSLFNFCCINIKAKIPTFYIWTEDQAGRGSERIGSVLFHQLDSLTLTFIHLDCGWQNGNSTPRING